MYEVIITWRHSLFARAYDGMHNQMEQVAAPPPLTLQIQVAASSFVWHPLSAHLM